MYRLFSEIRKQILPRVEEAENYNLSFEWKCNDFKDVSRICFNFPQYFRL